MNIESIKKGNFKHFERLRAPTKEKQIETVSYIEFLAQRMGIDISKWDIEKQFKNTKSKNLLITDRSKINKRFFKLLSKQSPQKKSKDSSLSEFEKMKDEIKLALKARRANRIKDEENRIQRDQRRLKEHQRTCNLLISNILASKDLIKKIKEGGDEEQMFIHIFNALKGGFWIFKTIRQGCIELITATDIIMQHKNPAAKIDIRVNLGKYKVKVRISDLWMTVHNYENNIISKYGCIHPYISDDEICFGNATSFVEESRAKGDLGAILNTLAALLTTYDPTSSPHDELIYFTEEYRRPSRRRR